MPEKLNADGLRYGSGVSGAQPFGSLQRSVSRRPVGGIERVCLKKERRVIEKAKYFLQGGPNVKTRPEAAFRAGSDERLP